jgi:hypothetical protein
MFVYQRRVLRHFTKNTSGFSLMFREGGAQGGALSDESENIQEEMREVKEDIKMGIMPACRCRQHDILIQLRQLEEGLTHHNLALSSIQHLLRWHNRA